MVQPVRKDKILNQEMLDGTPGIIRQNIVAPHERLAGQLPYQLEDDALPPFGLQQEKIGCPPSANTGT
ncbi:hypothetical protein OPIT5_20200 [Opitutaceae bacterium TAV5]|nr:hypothetical protein OPIT5_20200 [Opitutaceae bacterium TAV5]